MKNLFLVLLFSVILLFSCKKDSDSTPPEPVHTVTAISPASGPKNTIVTITGTHFGTNVSALKVYFSGTQATVQSATATSITAIVPAGASSGIIKVEKGTTQVDGPLFTVLNNGYVSTFAGSSQGFLNGSGTAARFNTPTGVVRDASGNIYVADRDNHLIRKITAAGDVTTFAGDGTYGFTNGTGTAARFNQPYCLTIDGAGNLYVGDRMNHSIRKITPAGVVTTLAGDGVAGSANGTGSSARFNEPLGLVCDASGNVFVADYINHLIRKVTPAGVVSTFAGSGTAGFVNGNGSAASFYGPFGITVDGSGNLFVADYQNHAIRKITASGTVTTLAGTGSPGTTDGEGSLAAFYTPAGLVADAQGNVYVCDGNNNTIRKITSGGIVTTIAGSTSSGDADGVGSAARFSFPIAVTGDMANSTIYIADFYNHRIRKLIID